MTTLLRVQKALADETRLRLMRLLLQGPLNVNEILSILGMGQSRISRHLKILLEAQLVMSSREGTWVYYRGNTNGEVKVVNDALNMLKLHERDLPNYESDLQGLENVVDGRRRHTQDFFDGISDSKNLQHSLHAEHYREIALRQVTTTVGIALDLGTGAGLMLPGLLSYAESVIAIDSSPTMLKMAKEKLGKESIRCDFRLGDITHLPVADREVDLVIACMVLHHISHPECCIKEAYRVLKPGGAIVIVDLHRHEDESLREKMADLWLGFSSDEVEEWLLNQHFLLMHNGVVDMPGDFRSLLFKARKKG